jgi:plasmid replication initiation protein
MQKLHKSKTPKVYKNKKLNKANFGTYNLNDYQVFLQLVSKIGGVNESGRYLQPEQLNREYTITAKEFEQMYNIENAYPILKRAGTKLIQSFITLEKPELFETWQIAVCQTAKYNHKEGSLTIKFNEDIMPYLAQVRKKFVLYNLKEVANFGSLYSTRLYELIQEFKDTGWLTKSVEQLREIFAVGKKFSDYFDFKKRTFAHAVEEINSQYEIDLKFEEIKEARKVVAIRFEYKPTFTRRAVDPHTGKERNIYIKPRSKPLTPEQIKTKEAKQQAQKTKREEKKAVADIVKKYGNNRGIDVDSSYAVQRDFEKGFDEKPEEFNNVHPDQMELEL